jgi:group I intron endonuclease
VLRDKIMPKLTLETVKNFIEDQGYKLLSTHYESARSHLLIQCANGHEFSMSWDKFRQGQRCLTCQGISTRISTGEAAKLLGLIGYELLTEAVTSTNDSIKYKCLKGHIGTTSIGNLKQGKRCRKCYWESKIKPLDTSSKVVFQRHENSIFIEEIECESPVGLRSRKGVYEIFCQANGKRYIGSASGRYGFLGRWKTHLDDLRKQKHHSVLLQRAWNKYGEANFVFRVIEEVNNTSLCLEKEQYWLDYFQSYNSEKGFNISPTASSTLGVKHSQEAIQKNRLARLGKKQSDESRLKASKALLLFNQTKIESNLEKINQAIESLRNSGSLVNITNICIETGFSRTTVRAYRQKFNLFIEDYRHSNHKKQAPESVQKISEIKVKENIEKNSTLI